jgi:hypothetical protein
VLTRGPPHRRGCRRSGTARRRCRRRPTQPRRPTHAHERTASIRTGCCRAGRADTAGRRLAPHRPAGPPAVLAVAGLDGRRGHRRHLRGDPGRVGRTARVRPGLRDRDHRLAIHRHPHPFGDRRARVQKAVAVTFFLLAPYIANPRTGSCSGTRGHAPVRPCQGRASTSSWRPSRTPTSVLVRAGDGLRRHRRPGPR